MRKVFTYKGYRKDMKLVIKQISSEKWGIEKINEVVSMLQTQDILPQSLKDHNLWGEYQGFRECHIYGDLVIVYKRDDKELYLRRIGRTKICLRIIRMENAPIDTKLSNIGTF